MGRIPQFWPNPPLNPARSWPNSSATVSPRAWSRCHVGPTLPIPAQLRARRVRSQIGRAHAASCSPCTSISPPRPLTGGVLSTVPSLSSKQTPCRSGRRFRREARLLSTRTLHLAYKILALVTLSHSRRKPSPGSLCEMREIAAVIRRRRS